MEQLSFNRRSFLKGALAAGALAASGASLCGCSTGGQIQVSAECKAASSFTGQANDAVYSLLDFSDQSELECALRGFVAAPESLEVLGEEGDLIWSQDAYSFLEGECPESANPSLWQNSQLNHLFGLYEVVPGIYQVRGFDLTNLTLVRGEVGWIVFDPLMSVECARAAMSFVREHLGDDPITGVVISHTHVDHYGGIKGVVTEDEVSERGIPIIVPAGFVEGVVVENIYAGTAMSRRAGYQYGTALEPGERGRLGMGIGLTQSFGNVSYIDPTDEIVSTGEVRVVDGVTMEFQLTPGTEAPSEMNTWFPQFNALWMAENCTGTLHNLYTLRGAEVRDGNKWANYIMETKSRYGAQVEVVFQSHNWPHWGNEAVNEYLVNTAAMYKFISTQSLMYLNQGCTASEIAHMIKLPDALERVWYTRQYYGTLAHNARSVYQKYMGYYDANPVNLHPLPPKEEALKLVEYLGDVDAVLKKAKADFDAGEYQWVAQITNALVFADPENEAARLLCADALEQLAYQAESGTWRNAYLTGAMELRANAALPAPAGKNSGDTRGAMTVPMMLDFLGVLVDANAAQNLDLTFNLSITDDVPYVLRVRSGVVLYEANAQVENPDAVITLPKAALLALCSKDPAARSSSMKIDGNAEAVELLCSHVIKLDPLFNVVTP